MSDSFIQYYITATRYALLEQIRNRFALILLLVFVPTWYYIGYVFSTQDPISFKFWVTEAFLSVDRREVAYLSLGLNAITLIIGFMFFASTRKDLRFDHRLILCGYPQAVLILAKLTSLLLVSLVISCYTTLVLATYWHPLSLSVVWLGFFCLTLSYGGLGILLGVLVSCELEGFFLIIMISLIDTLIQNPSGNALADKDVVKAFPAFAPMQIAVAGGFTHVVPGTYILFALAWFVGFSLLGLAVFVCKTYACKVHTCVLVRQVSLPADELESSS
jgi:ABC-2 type transport system permease protein